MASLDDSGFNAVHLCIDMQVLFADGSPWAVPWMQRTLPVITRLVEHAPERTIFTRFITPQTPDQARGMWRRYYQKWEALTRERVDASAFEILPPLRKFVPPAMVINRFVYSAFGSGQLHALLKDKRVDTLIFSGSEIDVCVLSSIYNAIDFGYRVIVAKDAISSSSDKSHDTIVSLLERRFDIQIEVATTDEIIGRW